MSTSAWISRLGIHYLILACFVCATEKKNNLMFLALEGLRHVRRYNVIIVTLLLQRQKRLQKLVTKTMITLFVKYFYGVKFES